MKRMEKLDLKKLRCQAKLVGTIVTVAGALLMTLYQGPVLGSKHIPPHKSYTTDTTENYRKNYFKGSMFLNIATLAWAGLFVLQVSPAIKLVGKLLFFSFTFKWKWKLKICFYVTLFWPGACFEDIQESSTLSYISDVLCGHSTSHCCHLCCRTQTICLENWLRHESPCCRLCCKSPCVFRMIIKFIIS